MYELADDLLRTAGFRGYEISNWARPGHESRHNLLYWTRRPVDALGPGAHAFDGRARRWTTASLDAYLAALLPGQGRPRLPPGGVEVVDRRTARLEAWILGLRLERGLPATAFDDPVAEPVLEWAIEVGLVETMAVDRVRLTRRGRLLANEVFSRLL